MLHNITLQKTLAGLFLLIGFTALYTHTRTEVHTFDALSYTQDVENKPFIELYHPHHLLYGPVGRIAVNLAEALGYEGRADQPIQFLNGVAGAIGVILLWGFGGSFTGRCWLPLSIAVLMGVGYAYWIYAAEVEVYTFAAVFIIATLYLLTLLERQPTPWMACLAGVAHAGAVMFHQTNSLFALPVGLLFLFTPSLRRLIWSYGLTLTVAVGVPYLMVGWFSGFRSIEAYTHWLTDYAQTGTWGGYLSWDHRLAVKAGLLNSISLNHTLATLFYGLVILGSVLGFRHVGRGWLILGISWLLLYGGFFWWWEPWNIEFWIALMPLWGMGMLAGLRALPPSSLSKNGEWEPTGHMKPLSVHEEMETSRAYKAPLRAWKGVGAYILSLAALILALLFFNSHYTPIRQAADADQDYYRQITTALKPHLAPTDLVLTRGNILDLYLPFYADHTAILSLRNQSADELMGQLDQAYRRGQIIYIDQIMLDEPRNGEHNPFGLSAEMIEQIKAAFPIFESVNYDGKTVFYSISQRAAPEVTGWEFADHLWGWLEFGATEDRYENGGWCISGGGDPWIESPPLKLDATIYQTFRVDLSIDQPAEYGQLFWRRKDEGLAETRSLRFPLEVGRHTYTLNLSGQNGWQDEIVFLRFDPIPENLEVNVCIYQMELSQ
jgi:hypothetical protein